MLRKLALLAVPLLAAQAIAARAAASQEEDDAPGSENATGAAPASPPPADGDTPAPAPAPPDDSGSPGVDYYPPPVEGPALRLPEPRTRIYLDGAFAISNDLSALPYISGKGKNVRVALGGVWRWRRFAFEGHLPGHLTILDIATILNQAPMAMDRHQVAPSVGDLTLAASWTERLAGDSEAVIAGFSVRGRLPTHSTRFEVHLLDGSLAVFTIPYYFHVEPALILGGAVGPFRYVINQGAIWLFGPNGYIQDTLISVPSIYFWDAHYAIGLSPWSFLGASVELATTIQLNHLGGIDYQKFNDVRAVWVAPAIQIHPGDAYRIDLIARLGLTRGEEFYGVLEYVGTYSFTLRVTRAF